MGPGEIVEVRGEEEMIALGVEWATRAKEHRVLLLEGEMGAGKTVFVKGLAQGLGLDPDMVQSPTFTLINEYRDPSGQLGLVHSDLYRLRPEEVEGTGLLDVLEWSAAPCAVEWPERLPATPNAVTLRIARVGSDASRRRVQWVETVDI